MILVDRLFEVDIESGLGLNESVTKSWRESVSMIIGNRMSSEAKTLISLGDKLRKDWGREEAAQVWY
jgi:hypothetical protein